MKNLTFSDLIDTNSLQMIQDSFAKYTKLVISVVDTDGNPITEQSGSSVLCDYIKFNSKTGHDKCTQCDRERTVKACEHRNVVFYTCHADLNDFSIPIIFEGRVIGIIHAGQVCTGEMDEELLKKSAEELSLPEEKYLSIAKSVTHITKEQAEETANFLMEFAHALSALAYENYTKIEQSRQMESAARSQASYVTGMTEELRTSMKEWLDFFRSTTEKYKDIPEVIQETDAILNKGQEVYSVIDGVVDYIHLSDGNVEYSESIYDVRALVNDVVKNVEKAAKEAGVSVEAVLDDSLPGRLMGNSGRIGQVLSRICSGAIKKTKNGGHAEIKAFCKTGVYSCNLNFKITCTGTSATLKAERSVRKMMKGSASDAFRHDEQTNPEDAGLSMIVFLIKQMSGSIDFENSGNDSVVISLDIPQLNCDSKDAER